MTTTSASTTTPSGSRPKSAHASNVHTRGRACTPRRRAGRKQRILARYTDPEGRAREVIARRGAAESTLVIDRLVVGRGDLRLVAHLALDEPSENALLVCEYYVPSAAAGCRCRALTPEDAHAVPFTDQLERDAGAAQAASHAPLADRSGSVYSLERLPSEMSIGELRWCRRSPGQCAPGEPVSLREVIAALESYEPVCAHTAGVIAAQERSGAVSVATLRSELVRVHASPIVLNRRLREAVAELVGRGELSMSEIAIRCGRVKHDRRGNESGETSWLARRLGILPEGGHSRPTPWIHSDVLALIARDGLGLSPREVEM